MKNISTKQIVIMALMIAMDIVLTRILSIQTPIIRISFGFLPIVITAVLYGPLSAAIVGTLADFTGASIFSIGAPFPGFTFTAFLTGAVYGLFIYKRPGSTFHIVTAVLIVTVILQLGLDTLWVHMITGSSYIALLPPRALRTVIMIPVQIILIKSLIRMLHSYGVKLVGYTPGKDT